MSERVRVDAALGERDYRGTQTVKSPPSIVRGGLPRRVRGGGEGCEDHSAECVVDLKYGTMDGRRRLPGKGRWGGHGEYPVMAGRGRVWRVLEPRPSARLAAGSE